MNKNIIKIIGGLFILFGVIDFAGQYLNYDLTGVSWSPYVAGVVGYGIFNYASKGES